MAIDRSNPRVVRARNEHAVASFYYNSGRIALISDNKCTRCAIEAIRELEREENLGLRR